MNIQRVARALQNKEQVIREVVLESSIKGNGVLHGSRAFNVQVPPHLRKKTKDYDVFVKKPRKTAREVEKILKRRLEGDVKVVKGSHKGTYRVKVNDETVADFSQKREKIKSKKIFGVEVKRLKTIKRGTQKLVKKKGTEFRREKDLDTLSRIRRVEEMDRIFEGI